MSDQPTTTTPTTHADIGGFTWTIPLDITAAQLDKMIKLSRRMAELGFTPPRRATFGGGRPPQRPLVQPFVEDDGTACCPDHTLRNGRHMPIAWRAGKDGRAGFWGCNAKAQGVVGEKINERGYCEHRFDWPAPKE